MSESHPSQCPESRLSEHQRIAVADAGNQKADTILKYLCRRHAENLYRKGNEVSAGAGRLSENASTWSEVKREYAEQELGDMQVSISDYEKSSNDKLEAKGRIIRTHSR